VKVGSGTAVVHVQRLPRPDIPVLVSTFLMPEGELGSEYEAESAAKALAPSPLG
jgi:hypothetical protein